MTSQINPNNIDGNYPVAGIPNNTQGMRDNFTETRTNFQYAANEITELQNKVVLKQALTGGTLDNDLNDNVLRRAVLQDIAYTLVNIPATSGTITLDYAAGSYQQINPTGACTLAFVNFPPAGQVGDIFFGFNVTNVNQTLTLPAAVSQGLFGIEGIAPGTSGVTNTITFGSTGNYTFELVTPDGGVTIFLYDLSRPRNKFFGTVEIQNSTAANSTVTGALTVDGGVGIVGNLYVGGNIVGNITVTGVSVVGNVVGGNITTSGLISATGNITTAGSVDANTVTAVVVVANRIRSDDSTFVEIEDGARVDGSIETTGSVLSSGNAGVGYTAGAGGTVTQGSGSGKATAVTLDKVSGEITMDSAQISGDSTVSFTLNNSVVANTDVMILNQVGGGNVGFYSFNANCAAGSASIAVHNMTNTNRSDAIVIRYAVIKAAVA